MAGVTALAATLRFSGLWFGFPQLTRPDEEAIVTVASRVLHGDFNPGFFDYPTLFMYVVAFVQKGWLGGPADPNDLRPFMIARVLSAILGTLSVPLLFVIVRRLYSTRTALVASALFATAFLHVRDSHFGVTDVPATFMTLAAFAAIVFLVFDQPRWPAVLFASVLCGLAASTKYNAGVIVLSLVTAIQVGERRRDLSLYAVAAAGALCGFLAATPYAWVARDRFLADFGGLTGRMAPYGALTTRIGAVHHFTFSLWYGLGPVFLAAAVAGIIVAGFSRVNRRRAMLTLSFPLLYYGVMGGGHLVYMRYMTPMIPFAALLAALAIDASAKRTGGLIAAVVLTAVVGFDSTVRSIQLDRLLRQTDSRALAADYIRMRFGGGATMLQNGSPYGQVRLWPEGIFPTDVPLQKRPSLVIIQTSPLAAYSGVPPTLRDDMGTDYRLVQRFDVFAPDDGRDRSNARSNRTAVFDQEDAWFVPVSGFGQYVRPGPTIEIFEKVQD